MAKILLIDDDQAHLILLSSLLSAHTVYMAENGLAGLEMAHRYLPDLVLCDVVMPIMDGYNFLMQVRTNEELCHLRVILMSAHAFDHHSQYLADGYLSKPVTMAGVGRLVQHFTLR